MTSGKILATVVGVAAAAILITQLASNKSEEEPLVENWVNVALGPLKETTYTCAKTGKNMAARDLTSGLPQSVFFSPNNLQPSNVIAATNVQANSIPNAGASVQYLVNNPQTQANSAQVFSNFAQAASVVEGYDDVVEDALGWLHEAGLSALAVVERNLVCEDMTLGFRPQLLRY